MNALKSNPWAGLSSYQDPKYAENPLKFCGREDDIYDLTQMVMRNIFVTLYGKSGIGKTSLLNAGVFPSLRDAGFLPISVRLNVEAADCSFQQCIISRLDNLAREGVAIKTVNVIEMPSDESAQDYLWAYFARTRFISEDCRTVFPVLAFDQFEEVFAKRRKEAEILLCQLAFMADESHFLSPRIIDGENYEYDYNFRFVASIREDDLCKLEDSIDNCYLGDLKKNRYRLRNLTEKGAREVVLKPGEGLFEEFEKDEIVKAILNKSGDSSDSGISTNMLSLICSRLYEEASKAANSSLSLAATLSFLKGNPFEKYFIEATSALSDSEMAYVEDKLIDEAGRRNSITKSILLNHISKGNDLIYGRHRILQVLSPSAGNGEERVELIHDSFCEPLLRQKERRAKRRKNRQIMGTIWGSIVCVVIASLLIWQNTRFRISERELSLVTAQKDSIMLQKDSILSLNDALNIQISLNKIQKDSLESLANALNIKNKELENSVKIISKQNEEILLTTQMEIARKNMEIARKNLELIEGAASNEVKYSSPTFGF